MTIFKVNRLDQFNDFDSDCNCHTYYRMFYCADYLFIDGKNIALVIKNSSYESSGHVHSREHQVRFFRREQFSTFDLIREGEELYLDIYLNSVRLYIRILVSEIEAEVLLTHPNPFIRSMTKGMIK